MNNKTNSTHCFFCGSITQHSATKKRVYCSAACTQASYRLKDKLMPEASQKHYRAQVAQQVISAHQPHPNPEHEANKMLELVRVKLSELQELISVKNEKMEAGV